MQVQPITPREVLANLALGEEVTDRDLSAAAFAATGRQRDRLWAEIHRRIAPVLTRAARIDGDEALSLMWELAVARFGPAVEKAGAIDNLRAWAKANIARGVADRMENVRAGRAVGSRVGASARRVVRAVELADGDRDLARELLAGEGYAGDVSDEAIAEALDRQATASPLSLSAGDDDEDWTPSLEGRVAVPARREAFDEVALAVLVERLSLTDTEAVVLVAEFGLDGRDPAEGARAVEEATGLAYEVVRIAQKTGRRKLRKAGPEVVAEAFAAARAVDGSPAEVLNAAARYTSLDERLRARNIARAAAAEVAELRAAVSAEREAYAAAVAAAPVPAPAVEVEAPVAPEVDAFAARAAYLATPAGRAEMLGRFGQAVDRTLGWAAVPEKEKAAPVPVSLAPAAAVPTPVVVHVYQGPVTQHYYAAPAAAPVVAPAPPLPADAVAALLRDIAVYEKLGDSGRPLLQREFDFEPAGV